MQPLMKRRNLNEGIVFTPYGSAGGGGSGWQLMRVKYSHCKDHNKSKVCARSWKWHTSCRITSNPQDGEGPCEGLCNDLECLLSKMVSAEHHNQIKVNAPKQFGVIIKAQSLDDGAGKRIHRHLQKSPLSALRGTHHLANWSAADISFILTKPQGRHLCAAAVRTFSSRKVQLSGRAATPWRKMGLGHHDAVFTRSVVLTDMLTFKV